ncbi:B2L15 protein, partial [Rhinopomastus cyanomelas]|nr:B2L15 protein [Rhinopomastus cyanomelas]
AMATFEEQTAFVAEALFSDLFGEDLSSCRSLETDSASSARELPDTFDPAVIASRLRQIGDRCHLEFEKVSSDALAEVLKGKVKCSSWPMEKFGAAVDSISRMWVDQHPELSYERAFLSVSVKLVTYIANKIQSVVPPSYLAQAINGNSRVRGYIEGLGGWVRM